MTSPMNRILITGHKGMLGSELSAFAKSKGHEVVGFDLPEHDITKREKTIAFVRAQRPDIILHAASMTAVDRCETEADTAYLVNATGTQNVCLAANELDIPLLYFSTDYIFDGTKDGIYDEWDAANPLSVYGKSKYAGEVFVRELCRRYFIVRISWLCGKNGTNFVETMLKRAAENNRMQVVDDQIGSPTFVTDLVPEVFRLMDSADTGIYHITNNGYCSWYDFAKKIFELRGLKIQIEPVSTKQLSLPAPRPKNSRLSHRNYADAIGDRMPRWEEGLEKYLQINLP
ncbi:MAG: dTDP-4-dehydrorhamnose reductase [Calditrichaeota bacterium]|nr:dTDP-4-dehydrorhamnose reductase [Calditrichota bacterium]